MSAADVAGVAAAGSLGAPARYLLDRAISRRSRPPMPWATLVINVSGSLLLGVITGFGLYHGLGTTTRLIAGTGFFGAYTTYSTYSAQTVALWEDGLRRPAATYTALSVVLSCVAAGLGLGLAAIA
jgi:CrcB protein